MTTPTPRVTVMTREGCPPCHTMQAGVERICAELGHGWAAVDVDADPRLRAAYGDRVPVLFVDGVEVGSWTLDEPQLRAALAGEAVTGRTGRSSAPKPEHE